MNSYCTRYLLQFRNLGLVLHVEFPRISSWYRAKSFWCTQLAVASAAQNAFAFKADDVPFVIGGVTQRGTAVTTTRQRRQSVIVMLPPTAHGPLDYRCRSQRFCPAPQSPRRTTASTSLSSSLTASDRCVHAGRTSAS